MSALLDLLCGSLRLDDIAKNERAMQITPLEPIVTHDEAGVTVSEFVAMECCDEQIAAGIEVQLRQFRAMGVM